MRECVLVDSRKIVGGASRYDVRLAAIEEFCECFENKQVQHDVSFEVLGGWQAARGLIDVANESELSIVNVGYQSHEGACRLGLRLMSEPGATVVALWEKVARAPQTILTKWDTTVKFGPND